MKEQYEKYEKFLGGRFFLFFPQKTKNKDEGRVRGGGKIRKVVEMGIGKVESGNKNLGGEKRKDENKN